MKLVQLSNLTIDDLTDGPVIVATRLASSFKVERRGNSYIAYNRTEWVSGQKTYISLDELRRDLARR